MESQLKHNVKSVAFLFICTKNYADYCQNAIFSLIKNVKVQDNFLVKFHIFTDKPESFVHLRNDLKPPWYFQTHKIDSYGWPEATLLRFKIINDFKQHLKEDYLIYLDSDMLAISNFDLDEILVKDINLVAFCPHPGYYISGGILKRFILIVTKKRFLISLVRSLGSRANCFGAWEENKSSLAYVPTKERRIYVHGAIFSSSRKTFLNMCSILENRINRDLENRYIAIWHDESHLNWYFSQFSGELLSSKFSTYGKYRDTMKKNPKIITVEKPNR